MKVAIFIDDFSPTGVISNTLAISRELVRAGLSVHLLAASPAGARRADVPDGVEVVALAPGLGGSRRHRMRRSVRVFREQLRRIKPDVVFSPGNQGHLLTIVAARAVPSARTLVRISNDPDRSPHLTRGENRVKRWWRRRKFSLIVGRADRIVVVSPHLLTSPALASAALAKRAIVIPNGVDLAEVGERGAAPCAHPWLADRQPPPVILAVGRLVEQKNFGTLVQAFAMARQSAPLRLLIIGDGPERERLLRRAAELGIGGEMAILPHTANPISCMARSAVLALPSWREGSSNVLLEALAVGLPVVASRTAGSAPDVLDGGRFGLLVDPHDPAALAAAILRQIGPDAIAPGARAADYSREVSLQKYVEVITSLCQSAGAGRGEH